MVSAYPSCIFAKLTTTPRDECHERIDSVHGAIYQKVESWADAITMYSLAYYDGTIEVVPVAGGVYDAPHFTVPSPNGRSGIAQFNSPPPAPRNIGIPQPHELQTPRRLGSSFYVVLRGEEVGIYGSWYVSSCLIFSCFADTNHC